ncbi:MAG: prolyl oligopeptidase family serine peptidase [Hyphomonas sp.]
MTGHYWGNNDTLILNVDIFENVKTSSGRRDYVFERAVAFNVKTQKPVMLMRDNRGWLDTNNLAAVTPDDPDRLLFSMVHNSTGTGGVAYAVVRVDLKTGKSRIIRDTTGEVIDAVHLPDGTTLAEIRYRYESNKTYTLQVTADGKTLFERKDLEFNPLSVWGVDASGENLIVFLDEGEPYGLFRMSLADGALTPVVTHGGLVEPVIDVRLHTVIGVEYTGDQDTQDIEDPKLRPQLGAIAQAMPDAAVTLMSWTDDRSESVLRVEYPGQPADYYIFDPGTGALSPIGNKAPQLEGRAFGKVQPVSYTARDGLEIPAYLTLPPGKTREDGPFPLILLPHGGPEARDTLSFDWWAQAYAAAGYAVLQPNYRGSAGFGTEFRDAGYGEYGDKMVLDVADGAAWAVEQGISLPGEACIAGASYGGYSALMVPLQAPGTVKCVVAVNAVTNPFGMAGQASSKTFYANYIERYLGADRFSASSDKVRITPTARDKEYDLPILLIASKEDDTVPYEQSDQLRADLRNRPDFKFVSIDGEDHYLRSSTGRYQVLLNSLSFLEAHLPTGN